MGKEQEVDAIDVGWILGCGDDGKAGTPPGLRPLRKQTGLAAAGFGKIERGKLRYALNYGEIRFPMLQQMVDDSTSKW